MITDKKLVICHNHWEFYDFGKPVCYGSKKSSYTRTGHKENKLENRILSFQRTKKNLRRLINTNTKKCLGSNGEFYTFKFLTLTFKKNIQNIQESNYLFKKFIQKFNYCLYGKINKIKYVAVIEFQKRGAIHYHIIFFNIPYIENKKISKIWGHGSIKIKKIYNIKDMGSYVCKYMTKNSDDPRLCGEKAYFTSRNLEKPKVVCDWKYIEIVKDFLSKESKIYETTFDSKYCGKSTYTLYNLTNDQKSKRQALAFLKL